MALLLAIISLSLVFYRFDSTRWSTLIDFGGHVTDADFRIDLAGLIAVLEADDLAFEIA